MKRLTKREGKHTIRIGNEWRRHDVGWDKLAEYEDLIEQGLLLELPCKIGDIVYFIKPICNSNYCVCDGNCNNCLDYIVSETKFKLDMIDRLGEFYFITKEEAEAKLKQKENKNMTGKVKWFSSRKGYGFITNENGEDVFVHYSDINMEGWKTLENSANVTYEPVETERGVAATNVVMIEEQ